MRLRKRFLVALAVSIALHLVVIAGPGWHLALDGLLEPDAGRPLEARLVTPPAPAARPVARPKPKKPRPAAPVATPGPVVSPAPPHEEPAAAVEAVEAVAPAPEVERAETVADEPEFFDGGPASIPALQNEIALPRYARITYRVSYGDNGFVVGEAIQELRHNGSAYIVRSSAETTGIVRLFRRAKIVNTSMGEIVGGRLRPQEFRVERNDRIETAVFDWTSGIVSLSNDRQIALPAQTQDMLSMVCQLALMPIAKEAVSIPVLTTKTVERHDFEVLGETTIGTPLGDKRALHLRNRQPDGKQATEVWLGLEDARLPIRIRHTDRRGDTFDQIVERIEFEEAKEGSADAHH